MNQDTHCPFYDGCRADGKWCALRSEADDFSETALYCIRGDFEDCPFFLESVLQSPGEHLQHRRVKVF